MTITDIYFGDSSVVFAYSLIDIHPFVLTLETSLFMSLHPKNKAVVATIG